MGKRDAWRWWIVAGLFGLALLTPHALRQAGWSDYRVVGIYSCGAAELGLGRERLQAMARSEDFAASVGGTVGVSRPTDLNRGIKVEVAGGSEAEARSLLGKGVAALERQVASIALEELELRLGYLRNIQAKTKAKAPVPATADLRDTVTITDDDAELAGRLTHDIASLRRYLAGGKLDSGLRPRLYGSGLAQIDQRLAAEQQQLERLKQIYADGQETVQAQRELLEVMRQERRQLEQRQARALLGSLRGQQDELRRRASEVIDTNRQQFQEDVATWRGAEPDGVGGGDWIAEETSRLQQQQKALSQEASFQQLGALEVRPPDSFPRLQAALWVLAVSGLLWALSGPRKRAAGAQLAGVTLELSERSRPYEGGLLTGSGLGEQIRRGLCCAMGSFPQRLLILGGEDGTVRASLSLLLAREMGGQGTRTRLVDFDLREKLLTRQLMGGDMPGLTELLADGGAAEEFFCSLPECTVQFAPAGQKSSAPVHVSRRILDSVTRCGPGEIVLIDASLESPLHLILPRVDAALCLTRPGHGRTPKEAEVLRGLRESRLPLWGISVESPDPYPLT